MHFNNILRAYAKYSHEDFDYRIFMSLNKLLLKIFKLNWVYWIWVYSYANETEIYDITRMYTLKETTKSYAKSLKM